MKQPNYTTLLICYFLIACSTYCFAQPNTEQRVVLSENLLKSFRNDSAYVLAVSLLEKDQELPRLDSNTLRRLLLVEATALERNRRDTIALKKLLNLNELSYRAADWSIYAQANLALADLYEKNSQWENCRAALNEAKTIIDQHQIDHLLPYYAIRVSFYHQIFGNPDSSRYYAQQAIEQAILIDQHLEEGVGYMLMGRLTHKSSYEESLSYRLQGIKKYHQVGNYVGVSFLFLDLSKLHDDYGKLSLALQSSDSSIHYALKAIKLGYQAHPIDQMYAQHAWVLRKMGQLDSAFAYMDKAQKAVTDRLNDTHQEQVVEINNQFQNEKKQQKINVQSETIINYNRQLKISYSLLFIIFLLGIILSYYYVNLQNAFAKTEEQARQLKQLNKAKNTLYTNISHELRTPLTLILGPLKRFASNYTAFSSDQQKLIDIAIDNTQQLQRLVGKILDLRKLEIGALKLDAINTNVQTFFQKNCGHFDPVAQRRGLLLNLNIDVATDAYTSLDQEKWRQIIYNLLSNALKFTPRGGTVSVKVEHQNDQLIFEVANSGSEILPAELPYVFERYYQTAQDTPASGGMGIGLALCKEYVQLFNGNISVQSGNRKTTFTVSCPVELEKSPLHVNQENRTISVDDEATNRKVHFTKPPATFPDDNSMKKSTILIVEDTEQVQDYIKTILEANYNLLLAGNGQDALNLLEILAKDQNEGVNLIISDIMMPTMDGFELLKILKATPAYRSIPLIMLTARAELEDRNLALRIGVDDYITKPFLDEELLATISTLLTRKEQQNKDRSAGLIGKEEETISEEDQTWLKDFEAYILDHAGNELLTMALLSQEFAMSESTLLRQMKRLTGLTPMKYIQEIRLEKARRLLGKKPTAKLSFIANEVGYKDSRAFSRSFKKRFGVSPTDYRNL